MTELDPAKYVLIFKDFDFFIIFYIIRNGIAMYHRSIFGRYGMRRLLDLHIWRAKQDVPSWHKQTAGVAIGRETGWPGDSVATLGQLCCSAKQSQH